MKYEQLSPVSLSNINYNHFATLKVQKLQIFYRNRKPIKPKPSLFVAFIKTHSLGIIDEPVSLPS